MDLREFIKTTVLSIHDAIIDIEEKHGGKYDLAEDIKRKQGVDQGTIHFDVAVVVTDEKASTTSAKGKASIIRVASVEGGKDSTSSSKDVSTSRISFDLVKQMREDRRHSDDA